MIDTHCHLTFPDFEGRVSETLRQAEEHGVMGAITVSTTTRDCLQALEIAQQHERVWCTSGVHPLYSDQGPHAWENLGKVAAEGKCVAWGELGLDNHYAEPAGEVQRRVLGEQLAYIESFEEDAARRAGIPQNDPARRAGAPRTAARPIVLHCREAFDDLIPILRRTRLDPARFVFHCFTGTAADMRKVLDFGAMVSFTGVVTYRNAREVQEAARLAPLSRIMVETDAPYLSPDPHRGSRPCKPWMVSVTARRLAELRGEDWEEFHSAINANTERFFGIR